MTKTQKVAKIIQERGNKSLTLDELKEMIGNPVWLVNVEPEDQWVRINRVDGLVVSYSAFGDEESYAFRTASYGKNVWAYRDKIREA